MDKTQRQQSDVVGQSSGAVPTPSQQPVAPTTPQSPAAGQNSVAQTVQPEVLSGSLAKEHAPIAPVTDFLKPVDHTEQQVKLSEEVAEAGVEQVPQVEHPQLGLEDKRAGLQAAKASVPVAQVTGTAVNLPYTQEQALAGQKTAKVGSSVRWLFEIVLREIKKTHMKLTQKEGQ